MNQVPTPQSSTPKSAADIPIGQNYQIPNNKLNDAFGELNITPRNDRLDLVLTILMEPVKEGSQTGVALDGSASMQTAFGRAWVYASTVDLKVLDRLKSEGKAKSVVQDGKTLLEYTAEGWQELINLGYVIQTENVTEPIAREVVPYLADKIDADGGTTVIYWACGTAGDKIEEVGDLTAGEAKVAAYTGPKDWGMNTHLLPALKYFVERFSDAKWGFYVFVTDGRLDDLQAVKDYTAELSKRIAAKQANPVKCVLIGVGSDVDESQMEQLDDLPDALDLAVDIWDHKIAKEMRDLRDIFAEVVDENATVAPSGKILDDKGALAANFPDGVPTLLRFSLPRDAKSFTLEVGSNKVQQMLFQ
jgi:hypothetical protein